MKAHMKTRLFGSTHHPVSVIGQGTWNMEKTAQRQAIAALRRGLELGMSHIDTAEMYGNGASEALIGEAISGRRDEVFLVSKVLPSHASRAGTRQSCERSLARLKTDRLDCYLLHWRGRYPLEETVGAFEQLRKEGKIRSWGVSNFDVGDLEELWAMGASGGPACNQVLYHLDERAIEHTVLPWCESHGVAVTAYSPLGQGDFPKPNSPAGRALADIGAAHGATARQIALAFLTRRPALFAIPKASNAAHVEENAVAGDLQLSESETGRIDRAFPRGPSRPLPML